MSPCAFPDPPHTPTSSHDEHAVLVAARPLLARISFGVGLAGAGRVEESATLLENLHRRLRGHPVSELPSVLPGVLVDLGLAQALAGRFGAAAEHLEEARSLAASRNLALLDTVARQNQGCLALYRGETAEAIDTFRELVPVVPERRREALRTDLAEALLAGGLIEEAGRTLAESPWRDGEPGSARTLVEAGFHLSCGDHRASLHLARRVRLRTGRGTAWHRLASRLERIALRAPGRPTGRVRASPDPRPGPLSGRRRTTGPSLPPSGPEAHDLSLIRAGLERALAHGDPSSALEWAEGLRPAAMARLRRGRPTPPPPGTVAGPVRERLFASLDGRAFVHYVAAEHQALALVAVAGRVRAVPLGPLLRLRRLLAHMRYTYASTVTEGAPPRVPTEVGRALLDPILPLVGSRALVVTGEPYLGDPPWGLFPGARDRPITVVATARALVEHSPARGPRPRVLLAAAAGPEGAGAEVRALSGIHPEARIMRSARRGRLLTALAGADLAHLAGHGRVDENDPLRPRLELTDGPLLPHDLTRVPSVPRTVVLATCWGGHGFLARQGDPGGFAGTLISLGTRTVVASPLPVPDGPTGEAVHDFHRALRKGADPPEAVSAHLGRVGFCCHVG
ncbi:CHAT domain-containing protein [Nocardiopsis alba]|uniref:CHAT domain-containing protein n=1 Tax=Nocardiopsis alba TaxID=53437 RepID=UPI0036735794